MSDPSEQRAIRAAALLADPTRRALYDAVAASPRPIARDEAAAAAGVGVSLAAFHLDRLAEAGLLDVEYRRRGARRGPGAGRPAKLYRRALTTVDFSLPARRYALAASLLAEAVTTTGEAAIDALLSAARAWGRGLAAELAASTAAPVGRSAGRAPDAGGDPVLGILAACGFEPVEPAGGGVIALRNCPFDAIAATHRSVACPMNLALLQGLADRLGGIAAVPDETPGHCCVAVQRLGAAPASAL